MTLYLIYMINFVYHDKPLVFIRAGYISKEACFPSPGSEYQLLNTFEFIKVISDTVLDMINSAYHDKPLIFIGATFREKESNNTYNNS